MSGEAPTVAIIGGTGKTGKWAVKGALVRGYKVRILGRSPDKVGTVLEELFPSRSKEDLLKEVTVVKGSATDQTQLKELFANADVVMSFLGMVKPPEPVVAPAVQAIMEVMRSMEKPPRFLSMSSIAMNDSTVQGRKAWGRCVMCLVIGWMAKSCFKDLAAAEEYIMANRGNLDVTIMRATVLADKKDYLKDYSIKNPNYALLKADEYEGLTFQIDRQHVAEAFLDRCMKSQLNGAGEVSIFERKTIATE